MHSVPQAQERSMKMMDEFKTFAMRGNVVDLAVGVVIGAAFGAIVNSLVGDVFMPLIGQLTAGIDFSKAALVLREAAADGSRPEVRLAYGKFIQAVINFIIVAFAVFLLVRGINTLRRKEKEKPELAPPTPSAEEKLLTEIRDLLKARH
jgi:large conductance mechanosensitive channel